VSWLRHNAYICQTNFPSIDLVVPMAFPNKDDIVTPECMSYIVMSVKNCKGTEDIAEKFLSKDAIEGVVLVPVETKTKKRKVDEVQGGGKGGGSHYVHSNDSLNVRLTLNAVKFINPGGVVSATDTEGHWIESSADKPFIAFAMSMGNTDRDNKLFIGEEVNSYQCISDLYVAQSDFRSNRFRPQRPYKHICVPRRQSSGST
jgi:hypothetical protein